jgi:hypothetical protein
MVLKNINKYDGSILHSRFAYKYLRDNVNPVGDVIIFRGGMDVCVDEMIDLEDVIQSDTIYSYDAINIIWEIPNLCPFGAVAFQRLFNIQIADFLSTYYEGKIFIDGDDIRVRNQDSNKSKKMSVSITYSQNNVGLGHTGINIFQNSPDGEKTAPDFACGLEINEKKVVDEIMSGINDLFYYLVNDIFVATSKIRIN